MISSCSCEEQETHKKVIYHERVVISCLYHSGYIYIYIVNVQTRTCLKWAVSLCMLHVRDDNWKISQLDFPKTVQTSYVKIG